VPSRRGAWGAAVDERAWDALFERHAQRVWQLVRSYGLDGAEATEACRLAWVALADHVRVFCTEDEVGPWLLAVAREEARRRAPALVSPT
jgi:DNA-directed RNA polymerase specialized sigma24 family protein